MGVDLVIVDFQLVGQGYRAHKLIGRTVVNDINETIGTLDDVIITSEATANDIGCDDNASPRTLIRPASEALGLGRIRILSLPTGYLISLPTGYLIDVI